MEPKPPSKNLKRCDMCFIRIEGAKLSPKKEYIFFYEIDGMSGAFIGSRKQKKQINPFSQPNAR